MILLQRYDGLFIKYEEKCLQVGKMKIRYSNMLESLFYKNNLPCEHCLPAEGRAVPIVVCSIYQRVDTAVEHSCQQHAVRQPHRHLV